jgi:hypothetical protein
VAASGLGTRRGLVNLGAVALVTTGDIHDLATTIATSDDGAMRQFASEMVGITERRRLLLVDVSSGS